MLSEGKAEINKLKKTVEQGIGDAKAIYSEVTGLWGWIKGLLGGNGPAKSSPPTAPVAAQVEAPKPTKKRKEPEPELSYEEYQTHAIHQVCEQLKTFFEIRRKLKEHCLELEETSKTTTTIEDSALDRVEIELQLENMTTQIREAMVYAPSELRDIYSRFLAMYGQIIEEQEFDRQLKRKQKRDAEAFEWQQRGKRIELAATLVGIVFLVLLVSGMFLQLRSMSRLILGSV